MRRFTFGSPPIGGNDKQFRDWVRQCFAELERAGAEELVPAVANDFTVSNFTPTRTLDMATASSTDIGNVLATLIDDVRRGGSKRTQ